MTTNNNVAKLSSEFDLFAEQEMLDPAAMPRPTLWRILVRPMAPRVKSTGGVILADTSIDAEEYNNSRGLVLAMGPLAYRSDRFRPHPDAEPIPACKVGDWVTLGKYAGQKIAVDGISLLIVNDDNITSVIPDPTRLRAYV